MHDLWEWAQTLLHSSSTMQLSEEWECLRDNCYIQHHLPPGRAATGLLCQCKKGELWHKIWVLQVAERVRWELEGQHGTDHGPQVRKDRGVQQRPRLSQLSKKENIYSERTAWLVFIPTPTWLTQAQNCNCSNQPHKRNLCFNKSSFPSLHLLPPLSFHFCLVPLMKSSPTDLKGCCQA